MLASMGGGSLVRCLLMATLLACSSSTSQPGATDAGSHVLQDGAACF